MQAGFLSVFWDMVKYSITTFVVVVGLMSAAAISISNESTLSVEAREKPLAIEIDQSSIGYGTSN